MTDCCQFHCHHFIPLFTLSLVPSLNNANYIPCIALFYLKLTRVFCQFIFYKYSICIQIKWSSCRSDLNSIFHQEPPTILVIFRSPHTAVTTLPNYFSPHLYSKVYLQKTHTACHLEYSGTQSFAPQADRSF